MTSTTFHWGTATAAHQIEGAWDSDGKGESIWDRYGHTPGRIFEGATADVACDHYHRVAEDVAIMQQLGVNAYRFSVSWPRVMPDGRNRAAAGLDFYSRLVDALLDAGITPFLTLYHWDLPQSLQDEGGWVRRGVADDFAAYADLLAQSLGDRVQHWITLNEPWVSAVAGHYEGTSAPGVKDLGMALRAGHHLLLAHGNATSVLRSRLPAAKVGISLNLWPVQAASDSDLDLAAAARRDGHFNRWFLDPVFGRGYPADMLALYAESMPEVDPVDLSQIGAGIDFLGVNYYYREVIAFDPDVPLLQGSPVRIDGAEYSAFDWEVYPSGLHQLLTDLHATYAPAELIVTENGMACHDVIESDGGVPDQARIAYLESHIAAVEQAVEEGVPVTGYFVWSLLDNFEWDSGYSMRFGLVHVDFSTQRRTIKNSGWWYADFLRTRISV